MAIVRATPLALRRLFVAALLFMMPLVCVVAVAWACNPQAHLSLDQSIYEAGSTITATGAYFPPGASVTVSGPTGSTTVTTSAGGGFTVQLAAPMDPGSYTITASRPTGGFAPASFTVVAAATPPVVAAPVEQTVLSPALAPDLMGPEISRPTLSGERVAVAANGSFVLLCARFNESGVTGTCGLTSRRRSQRGNRPLLVVAPKAFRAPLGRAVRVRFYLSAAKLKRLKSAQKLHMDGSVTAEDLLGNRTTLTFALTLKAPRHLGSA